MKTLLLLRHAKSSWKDASLDDHDRPLNKRGKQDAPCMGRLLRDEGPVPDVIVSSTAKRARKTAEKVAETSGYGGKIEFSEKLYHAEPEAMTRILSGLPEEHGNAMLVGHNPGLEEFLELLTGQYQRVPTAALLQVQLDIGSWKELESNRSGRLVKQWLPRELPEQGNQDNKGRTPRGK
jgi:phosphohistidine phosphatase